MSVAETLTELFAVGFDKTLLICLGNSLRCDDGVGPYLGQQLAKVPGLLIEDAGDRPERAIDFAEVHRPQKIIFLDAANFGGQPGTLRLLATSELVGRSLSSHRLPLTALIGWIETEYPTRCLCLGIQVTSVKFGEELTPPVARTASQIIEWFEGYAGGSEQQTI